MNKDRRSELQEIKSKLESAVEEIESAKEDEQSYYDNMPESIQTGDKGDAAQEVISELDNAIDCLNSAIDHISMAAE